MGKRGVNGQHFNMGNYWRKGVRQVKIPNRRRSENYIDSENDRRLFPDGTMVGTTKISDICEKLTKYEEAAKIK